jgi:3-dehydroquinate synthase
MLSDFAVMLQRHTQTKQAAIISNERVFNLYGESLLSGFPEDIKVKTFLVPDGEEAKSIGELDKLYTQMLENKFERSAVVVALGGGVVGDLAGFLAATFLRGVRFVQVPTTLLAQVDSSIGGKTGINHPLGKNLIGAFKQPEFVFSDVSVLQTLDDEEVRCGLGEVIKYGFILNRSFFGQLEERLNGLLEKNTDDLQEVVYISSGEKARIVEKDEKESRLRMVLNFGHTFAHALEREFSYSGLKHGEAVVLGMKCALLYEKEYGTLPKSDFDRGMNLLNRIPVVYDKSRIDIDKLTDYMFFDKKVKDGNIRLVLTPEIGRYRFETVADVNRIKPLWEILR